MSDYAFAVVEYQSTPEFKTIALAPQTEVVPVKIEAGDPGTQNEPLSVLTDGHWPGTTARSSATVSGTALTSLISELSRSIRQVNTFSYNQSGKRGRQRFVLYGSRAGSDPGWNVEDLRVFTPIIELDTRKQPTTDFVATGVHSSGGQSLGSYRWLIWAVAPVTETAGGENTAFQEFQVVAE